MNDKQKAEIIYNILGSQRFADWETDRFGRHIAGDLPEITKEEILTDIYQMFLKNLD